MERLEGRVAVVTGGASGIGRGMAEAFGARGMKLVLADIERSALDATVAELTASGLDAVGFECDVSDEDSIDRLARAALDAYGAVHVLCNNAGVAGGTGGPLWQMPLEDWDWVMDINLRGVLYGIRRFVPIMIEQDDEAHVVNTASMAGLMPGGGVYGVSKSACVALSETLFNELAMQAPKVGVSVLCPGWVRTRILESERNRPEAPRRTVEEMPPIVAIMQKIVTDAVEGGLDPRKVGDIVVDAIQTRRFYILTHPWESLVEQYAQSVVDGRAPVRVAPPGMKIPGFEPPDA